MISHVRRIYYRVQVLAQTQVHYLIKKVREYPYFLNSIGHQWTRLRLHSERSFKDTRVQDHLLSDFGLSLRIFVQKNSGTYKFLALPRDQTRIPQPTAPPKQSFILGQILLIRRLVQHQNDLSFQIYVLQISKQTKITFSNTLRCSLFL